MQAPQLLAMLAGLAGPEAVTRLFKPVTLPGRRQTTEEDLAALKKAQEKRERKATRRRAAAEMDESLWRKQS
jgi:hypothetical protein